MKPRAGRSRGFTLIELMIVVGIIGMLSTIALPMYQNYVMQARSVERTLMLAEMEKSLLTHYASYDRLPNENSSREFAAPLNPAGRPFDQRRTLSLGGPWNWLQAPPAAQVYYGYFAEGSRSAALDIFCVSAFGDLDSDLDYSYRRRCHFRQGGAMSYFAGMDTASVAGVF